MSNRNRGKNTGDDTLFGSAKQLEKMKSAVQDMQYLLSRNYAEKASSELVGNHYRLKTRQIQAVRELQLQKLSFRTENLNNSKFLN
jgi:hypothetical protein